MKQVTAVLIGAGLRGAYAYSSYALDHPDEFRVVAVAEPDEARRREFAARHQIPEDLQFVTWEELLGQEKLADTAMVCTQDNQHFEPVIKALEKGYHVLCEKPMSSDEKEIVTMGTVAGRYGRILSICHVLRYSPFFVKLKELLDEGRIGRLMTVQQIEEVGFWHHAHSFVRGNWRNAEESSPMILAKCCHDMDILLWLIQSHCTKVSSFGNLTFFRKENAPADAPERCMDGCPHRDECVFYAPRFYLEHPKASGDGLVLAVSRDPSASAVLDALRSGPYGRCVFHCDNSVVDHQVVNLEFKNQVSVSFTMSAFTNNCAREINLMGTRGQINGNMETGVILVRDFLTGNQDTIHLNTPVNGHSGSDSRMMKEFVRQAAENDEGKTSASASVESHLIALAAEKSRLSGETIDFVAYEKEIVRTC